EQNESLRPLVVLVLGDMGAEAREAGPSLGRLLDSRDPETTGEVLITLAHIGPAAKEAAPALMQILKNPDDPRRVGAAYALTRIGAEEALPILAAMAAESEKDERVRLTSAWALVQFDPTNKEYVKLALPRLIHGLARENPLARKEVADALAQIGESAAVAVPELARTLEDPVPDVR